MLPERRPKTIPIVAAFLFAATAVSVTVGVSLMVRGAFSDWLWSLNRPAEASFRKLGSISSVLLLALGIATFAGALGLLQRRKWAWWLAVVLFAINGGGDIVSLAVTGDWLRSVSGTVICSVFLYSLCRDPVRLYFRSET